MSLEPSTNRRPKAPRDPERDAALLDGQRRVLELLARAAPLSDTLTALCDIVERRLPNALCSVLLLNAERRTLHHGAAPRLPRAYCEAIDGVVIGPLTGSCGTAAYERREITVESIATDARWADYSCVALPHGLRACASLPIFDSHNQVLGTFAIYHADEGPFEARELELLRDVTGLATLAIENERQRAALSESEERFRLIAEQTGHVIYDSDLIKGKAVWAGALDENFGGAPQELEDVSFDAWLARVHPDERDRVRGMLERVGPGGSRQVLCLQYRVRHRDGSYRDVEQRGVALTNDQGILTRRYGVLADVTEQRRTEAALRQTQKLDSLGVLAGGLAHDFNNLLTVMLGNINLAEMSLSPVSPAMRYLKNLEGAALRAADLTRQMLAYSGKGRFVIKPVDLSQLVDEMTHLLSVAISKKVSMRYNLASDLPAIEADVAQLQQVVMNLVTNAAEAIGNEEGFIAVTTDVRDFDATFIANTSMTQQLDPGRYVTLEVSDTGCGMSADVLANIFDPFFTTKTSGRGLGLSAMLGILRAHQAGIELYSELGVGSTFKVFFPASTRQAEPSLPRLCKPAQFRPAGLALVVDDEAEIRQAAGQMLRELGFTVLEAGNGFEAVECVQSRGSAIALVLMDLTMPRMGGREASAAIRNLQPAVPIILCSGYDEHEAIRGLFGTELTGFLQKPYRFQELRHAVEVALSTLPAS